MSRIVSCRMTCWHSRSPRTYMGQSRATVVSQRSGHAVDHFSAPWIKTTDTQSKTTPEHPQHPNDIHSAAALAHRRSILLIRPSPSPRKVDCQLQCCSLPLDRYSIYPTGLSRKSSLHLQKKYASRISCCDLPLLGLARHGPTPCLSRSFWYRVEHTRQRHSRQHKARVRENLFLILEGQDEARRPETRSGYNKKSREHHRKIKNDIACRCSNEEYRSQVIYKNHD